MSKKYDPNRPVFVIQWHITGLCDQSCAHCYMVNDPQVYKRELEKELSLADCKSIIDSFLEFCEAAEARPRINFTGGDPLLRPDFFEILQYASLQGISLNILGNPFHLSAGNISRMKELGVVNYQVSLDGMEKMHDHLRKQGSFSATVKAIKLLVEYKMRAVVMFTLSKKNHNDLFDVMKLVSNLGVKTFAFARLSTNPVIDTRISREEAAFTPHEYRSFLIEVQGVVAELKAKGSRTNFTLKDHLWKLLLYEQGKFSLESNPEGQIISGCHIGARDLAVLADGTVFACRRFNSKIGKMPEQSVMEVFTSKELDFYRDIKRHEICSRCPLMCYCRGCPAVAFGASGGNFYAPDPQCWRFSK
ncbi:MAG: radical SAM protein [Candidatus Staskawiczbacteria bacterium]|nr:radical SAM protein [Candidatus Staskawiczbacteria bacterium]